MCNTSVTLLQHLCATVFLWGLLNVANFAPENQNKCKFIAKFTYLLTTKNVKIMKKILIAAIAVFGFTTANAQYTAEKGDFQTSVNFTPFASDGNMFNNVGINGALFVSDKSAIRLGLNFGINSTKDTSSDGKFGINVGYENHFKSYDRVDLYAGAQVGFKTEWGKTKTMSYKENGEEAGLVNVKSAGLPREISVAAFTGVNFYFYKKLYVGAEINLKYAHTSYSKGEYYDPSERKVIEYKEAANGKNSLGFNVEPQLKLGWTF